MGAYKNWATITSIQQDLTLTSLKGYYYSTAKSFFFKDSVHVKHPEYELFSDTLEFRTNTSTALFHGPTEILLDSMNIHCTRGIYQTGEGLVRLWSGATIYESSRIFYADSISYNEKSGIGEGFCNVDMIDIADNIQFFSDYLWKSANNDSLILKENAKILQFNKNDTTFIAADTIFHHQDTTDQFKMSIAENNVSIINGNIMIACDSAFFNERDSIIKLHKAPIMWSDESQMTADSIFADYYDEEFHKMYLYNNALIVSEHQDSLHFDQIKGKMMTAWLDSGKIQKVYIESNAQTLYYTTEDKTDTLGIKYKEISGMNKIDCNEIFLYFAGSEIERISFIDQPTAIYYPIDQVPANELFLKGFIWDIDRKPELILVE